MQGKNILLVDDAQDFVDTLAERLCLRGFTVQKAYDGQAALDILATWQAHIAIVDLQMPEMSGEELVTHVKTLYPHVPILLLTGDASTLSQELTRAVYACLTKPLELSQLLEVIHAAVNAS